LWIFEKHNSMRAVRRNDERRVPHAPSSRVGFLNSPANRRETTTPLTSSKVESENVETSSREFQYGRDFPWSREEKAIARKAFNLALGRELDAVIREAKHRASKIKQPSELWDLERYLTRSRQTIDRSYDYRYSVLPRVFGSLIRKGRLSEDDLQGLSDDKLTFIRRVATL
jgi:hypothetical protein